MTSTATSMTNLHAHSTAKVELMDLSTSSTTTIQKMGVVSFEISNFRNYKHKEIALKGTHTVFLGEPATGKTNALVALYLHLFFHRQLSIAPTLDVRKSWNAQLEKYFNSAHLEHDVTKYTQLVLTVNYNANTQFKLTFAMDPSTSAIYTAGATQALPMHFSAVFVAESTAFSSDAHHVWPREDYDRYATSVDLANLYAMLDHIYPYYACMLNDQLRAIFPSIAKLKIHSTFINPEYIVLHVISKEQPLGVPVNRLGSQFQMVLLTLLRIFIEAAVVKTNDACKTAALPVSTMSSSTMQTNLAASTSNKRSTESSTSLNVTDKPHLMLVLLDNCFTAQYLLAHDFLSRMTAILDNVTLQFVITSQCIPFTPLPASLHDWNVVSMK